ncbi:hypothetical protein [Kocuria sp. CH-021]|uniref:hypothetical protein n=1 Tax=Kocuria sp. CH-021 TaxID=3406735 RepID=UPI003C725859
MQSTPRWRHLDAAFVYYALAAGLVIWLTLTFPATALVVTSWGALVVAARVLGPTAISPALIVSVGLAVVAVTGWVFYPLVVDAPYASGILLPADPDLIWTGFKGLTIASLGASMGAIAAGLGAKNPPRLTHLRPLQMSRRLQSFLVLATIVPTLLLVMLRGVGSLLNRSTYLSEQSSGGLGGVLALAGVVSMVVCGYLLRTQRRFGQFLVLSNVVVFTLFIASTGSRRLAAIPVLLAIGYYVARPSKSARRLLVLSIVVSLLLLPLPLYWRTLGAHGLIPYWHSLGGYLGSDLGLGTALKTILISVPIIGATVRARLPEGALTTAVDPRGGQVSGWYEIAGQMRLNPYAPTAGVGELLYQGALTLSVFFLVVGLYLGLLDRHVRSLIACGHQIVAFAHVGLASLFLVYVIQYNLRSSMRMLYYSLALWIAYAMWQWAFRPKLAVARSSHGQVYPSYSIKA